MRSHAASCLLISVLLPSFAFPASALSSLETEDLRLLYFEGTENYLVPHAARCFENSMGFQRELWGYSPSEPVTVLLSDFSDLGNAAAGSVPRNALLLETAPLSLAYETAAPNERMNWLMNHELVHITTVDQAARSDRFFRKFFRGKVRPIDDNPESILYFYLTTPRDAAPRWYHEGIAVFVETWMAGGLGRAQGPYDEMVFRSMVRDGSRFYDPLGLVSEGTKIDFQVEVNSYLYGTRFMSYLAHQYSPESLIQWVSRTDGTKRYYKSQFKQVYGKSLEEAWQEWVSWEHEFQQANLAAIRQYPITPHEDLSDRTLGSVSRPHFDRDRGKLYAAFNYPGVVAHVGAISIEDGSVEKIIDVKDPVIYSVTSLSYDPESKTIFYTTDNLSYRDLRSVDPETKESRTLLKDARVGELVFNRADRSIWGVRHFNGIASLVRIPHPYEEWIRIHSWPYGEVLYDLDISPDGRLLSVSVGEINGRHSLRVMRIDDLLEGEVTPIAELDFGNTVPSNFAFSPDGRYLYGSSYYTGVSNIFRFEIATQELEAVTNCETGFFRPIPLGDDQLIVFRYTGEGFVPATIEARPLEDVSAITFLGQQIVEEHPVIKDWNVGSPSDIPLDSMITRTGEYKGVKSIKLESVYPVVEGYKDFFAYGLRVNLSDPLLLNRLSITASYTPNEQSLDDDERHHLQIKFQRYDWKAGFKLNDADFYDLFGPTRTSRRGYSLWLGHDRTLIYDKPRVMQLNFYASFHGDLEQLPRYQNVDAPSDKLFYTAVGLGYGNVRASLGHVDVEKGHSWQVIAGNNRVEGRSIPSILGIFDVGFALPLHHSSIWLRSSAGFTTGSGADPFANFFFGGFGNNYVDHREAKRYREYYSFPGVNLNEIGGKTYAKLMVEWNLPPARFRSLGKSGFYASWLRPALFASGVVTNVDDEPVRRTVENIGVQLDLQFTLLSRLEMMLSAGYAVAFEDNVGPEDEFMISLKILR